MFTDHMYYYHYIPFITKPTRFPANNFSQPTLLDKILGNRLTKYSSFIVLYDATDPCPTFSQISHPCPVLNNNNKYEISFIHNTVPKRYTFSQAFDWLSVASDELFPF